MSRTTYLVLIENEAHGNFTPVSLADAPNPTAAIIAVYGHEPGKYAAVPLRNWTHVHRAEREVPPVVPQIETNHVETWANLPHVSTPTRPAGPLPGQTTIEEEIEADALAAEIEGDEEVNDDGTEPIPVEEEEEVPA